MTKIETKPDQMIEASRRKGATLDEKHFKMSSISGRFGAKCFLILSFISAKNLCFPPFGVNGEPFQGRRREIVNGYIANPSDAKFFVKSGRDDDETTADYVCGGMLVHSDIVLTAAHCQGAFNYGVFLYDPNTNDYTREMTIDLQIRYPYFNGIDTHNDILLLRLSSNSDLPTVEMNSNNSTPTDDDVMTVYGIGKKHATGSVSNSLRVGEMKYIDNEECTERVQNTANSIIWDDVLCADPYNDNGARIEEGSSVCQGDSGGPLLDSSNTLVGVTSWNFFCKSDHLPDGFARVAYFHDWITQQICFMSKNPPTSKNKCPNGTSPPPPAPEAIRVFLTFNHDFYPEETFFRIISKDRNGEVEYAGPKYVPARESAWRSQLFLVPGVYTIEIFDMASNGLSPGHSDSEGWWTLIASYENGGEKLLASGGADFGQKDLIDFVVESIESHTPPRRPTQSPTKQPTRNPTQLPTGSPTQYPTQNPTSGPTRNPNQLLAQIQIPSRNPTEPSIRRPVPSPTQSSNQPPIQSQEIQISDIESSELKEINIQPSKECRSKQFIEELSLGSTSGVVCNCVQDDLTFTWQLSCYDSESNSKCVENRGACGTDSPELCCGDRRCSNGICRTVFQGTHEKRKPLLLRNYGGSSSRLRGAHGGGN